MNENFNYWRLHWFETAAAYPNVPGSKGSCKADETLSKGSVKLMKYFPNLTDEDALATVLA